MSIEYTRVHVNSENEVIFQNVLNAKLLIESDTNCDITAQDNLVILICDIQIYRISDPYCIILQF